MNAAAPVLRRIEEIGLNALHTQQQLLHDGWLLRLAPGKTKRARSVNAFYPSTMPVAQKIAYCERLYAERGLPALFRITPFVQPPELESVLLARGYLAFETTQVQLAPLVRPPDAVTIPGVVFDAPEVAAFADAVGDLQQAPPEQRLAHRQRMMESPLRTRGLIASVAGQAAATGTVVLEDGVAGVFSMITAAAHRRRGLGGAILGRLLAWAWERGAHHAYLQVEERNREAMSIYRRFGFATGYTYHYLGRPGECH